MYGRWNTNEFHVFYRLFKCHMYGRWNHLFGRCTNDFHLFSTGHRNIICMDDEIQMILTCFLQVTVTSPFWKIKYDFHFSSGHHNICMEDEIWMIFTCFLQVTITSVWKMKYKLFWLVFFRSPKHHLYGGFDPRDFHRRQKLQTGGELPVVLQTQHAQRRLEEEVQPL